MGSFGTISPQPAQRLASVFSAVCGAGAAGLAVAGCLALAHAAPALLGFGVPALAGTVACALLGVPAALLAEAGAFQLVSVRRPPTAPEPSALPGALRPRLRRATQNQFTRP
jgi:hypothetical protein